MLSLSNARLVVPDLLRSNVVRSLILLATLISVFGISAGRAQETIDIAKITCDQFLTGQIYDAQTFSIWLNGYYSGMRHDTVVDVSALKSHALDMMDDAHGHHQKRSRR